MLLPTSCDCMGFSYGWFLAGCAQVVAAVLTGEQLARPHRCPKEIYRLMQQCWARDPAKRPSFCNIARAFRKWREDWQAAHSTAGARTAAAFCSFLSKSVCATCLLPERCLGRAAVWAKHSTLMGP